MVMAEHQLNTLVSPTQNSILVASQPAFLKLSSIISSSSSIFWILSIQLLWKFGVLVLFYSTYIKSMIFPLGPQRLKYLALYGKSLPTPVLQDSWLHSAFLQSPAASDLASDHVAPLHHFSRTSHPPLTAAHSAFTIWPLPTSQTSYWAPLLMSSTLRL